MKLCEYCSGKDKVYHDGKCPKVKTIEYYLTGAIRRVEFFEEAKVQDIVKTIVEKAGCSHCGDIHGTEIDCRNKEVVKESQDDFWARIANRSGK